MTLGPDAQGSIPLVDVAGFDVIVKIEGDSVGPACHYSSRYRFMFSTYRAVILHVILMHFVRWLSENETG
ncbi:MAG: hypothetical protein AAF412_14295, partial [Pseudomonadota bacterium]